MLKVFGLEINSVFIRGTLCALGVVAAMAPGMSRAEDPERPVVVSIDGEPLRFTLKDGRVAVLKRSIVNGHKRISLPFDVYDNSCSSSYGQSCRMSMSVRKLWYFFVWEKNPDATKIGKVVRVISRSSAGTIISERSLDENFMLLGTEHAYLPEVTADLQPMEIECTDFSWLPGESKSAPNSLLVTRWDGERMLENPETRISENRVMGGYIDARFSKISDTKIKLDGFRAITSYYGIAFPIPFGDIMTWNVQSSSGEVCQADLKPAGLTDATNDINTIDKHRPDPEKETDLYISGSGDFARELKGSYGILMSSVVQVVKGLKYVDAKELE